MTTLNLNIHLLSYWHAGTGEGRGAALDAVVLRNNYGLPYLPGKTGKGLLREATQLLEDYGDADQGTTDQLFGVIPKEGDCSHLPGLLLFEDAVLAPDIRNTLVKSQNNLIPQLFDTFSSTAIERDTGIASEKSLRTIEVTIPLTLHTRIHGPEQGDWKQTIESACKLVRALGSHRNRGLGRCRWEVVTHV